MLPGLTPFLGPTAPPPPPFNVLIVSDGQWTSGGTANASSSITGGVAPYSYLWSAVSGADVAFGSPTSSATGITTSNRAVPATIRLQVTDSSVPPAVVLSDLSDIAAYEA